MSKEKVYIIQMGRYFKIGVSKKPKSRLKSIDNTLLPETPIITHLLYCKNAYQQEHKLHRENIVFNVRGEWFLFNEKELNRIVEEEGFKIINKPVFNEDDNIKIELMLKNNFNKQIQENKRLILEYKELKKNIDKKLIEPLTSFFLYMLRKRIKGENINTWQTAEKITEVIKMQGVNLKQKNRN